MIVIAAYRVVLRICHEWHDRGPGMPRDGSSRSLEPENGEVNDTRSGKDISEQRFERRLGQGPSLYRKYIKEDTVGTIAAEVAAPPHRCSQPCCLKWGASLHDKVG